MIESRIMPCTGHIARMWRNNACSFLVNFGKLEGNTRLGEARRRLENNIKRDLKGLRKGGHGLDL
jgi:hypothetical protein